MGNFIFDVGATTISGLRNDQPLYKFIREANIENEVYENIHKLSTGMVVHIDGKKIFRYADEEKWMEECANKFGNETQIKKFWNLIFRIEKKSYKLIDSLKNFPPVKLLDYLSLPKNPLNIDLLYYLTRSVKDVLKNFDLHKNQLFSDFINEQLIITSQAYVDEVPFLPGALALNYPAESYYVNGGMSSFAQIIEKKFTNSGGEIKFKHSVLKIKNNKKIFSVETNKGAYKGRNVISNIPVWGNEVFFDEGSNGKNYFNRLSKQNNTKWGAVTLYFAVEDNFDDIFNDFGSLFHQVHFKSKVTGSKSFFVSISKRGDLNKAPDGWRTVTISTHTVNPEEWKNKTKEEYEQDKQTVINEIFEKLNEIFPGFEKLTKKYILSASPKTFEFYTKRKNGCVGGIPATFSKNFFRQIPSVTPVDNFFLTGDTVFPGQGAPAVIFGAMKLIEKLTE